MDIITENKNTVSQKYGTPGKRSLSVMKVFFLMTTSLCFLATGNALASDWEFKPSLKVASTYSDNIDLSANGDSDKAMEVSPAISINRDARRLRLNLDYRLQNLTFVEDSDRNSSNHRFSTNANAEAIDDTLFVDFRSSFNQQLIDRRTSASSDAISGGGNLSDVYSYSISPYWQQRVGDVADYELRYTYDMVNSEGSTGGGSSDSEGNSVAFDIVNGTATGRINWNAAYDNNKVSYDSGEKSDTESGSALVGYQLTDTFNVFVSGRYENNEFIGDRGDSTPDDSSAGAGFTWEPSQDFSLTLRYNERLDPRPDEDETFVSGDIFWAPTGRTDLRFGFDNSFFGDTYNGSFSHRTRWTRWNLTYNEGTSNFRDLFLQQGLIVCPTGATALAQCRVLVPGESPLPGEFFLNDNGNFFTGINANITEDTFISKTGRASVSVVGAKNTVTLSATNTRRKFVADNATEEDSSVDVSWTYQVAPFTDSRVTVGRTQEQFDDGQEDDFMRYLWRVTRQVSASSIFYVEAQINERDSATSSRSYDENRLTVSFEKFF